MSFEERLLDLFPNDVCAGYERGSRAVWLCWTDDLDPGGEIYSPAWWADDGAPVAENPRPCGTCGIPTGRDEPDACLGRLPYVTAACCGHGVVEMAYVVAVHDDRDEQTLREESALRYFAERDVGPGTVTSEAVGESYCRICDLDGRVCEFHRDGTRYEAGEDLDEMMIIRAKWLMDGATSLAECAGRLRAEADGLDRLAAEGWTLNQPVEDDYGYLRPPERPADAGG